MWVDDEFFWYFGVKFVVVFWCIVEGDDFYFDDVGDFDLVLYDCLY